MVTQKTRILHRGGGSRKDGIEVAARVEKFDGPAIEPIELLNIRIRVEILSDFRKFCQNSSEVQKFED